MKTADPNFAMAEMLIRKPAREVFEAFANPEITTKFWFTKSSGKIETGAKVDWTWEMYNHTVTVFVKKAIPDELISIEWGNYQETTTVEWTFKPISENETFVSIVNSGIKGNAAEIIAQVRDSTEGFTLVLAGLKAYLEHGIQLNLVGDRFPQ
ncbi:SRPBCC family protein [Flavobacterium humi]|uniref:Polyketide cyclase n=1 Tax=Flavobacterium humi TaxID=2562683 RepID=A0A4Z0LCZ2_9FLAO|nr:SRPBCC family protein [Flavobacterium humi]TGD59748.1 polyketide cyclase [Flavobacterium humi]